MVIYVLALVQFAQFAVVVAVDILMIWKTYVYVLTNIVNSQRSNVSQSFYFHRSRIK